MSPEPIVEYDGVEFAYEAGTPVLRGIDLAIEAGEFVTVIGQNGAGKSTFAKHLNGLLKPDAGSVRITHDDETFDTAAEPMKRLSSLVGYVFQNPDDQIFHTRVDREIEYGMKNIGIDDEERRRRLEDVLEAVRLAGRGRDNPFSMSIGERQRLAIAGILAMRPALICVDEPTTGQDVTEARRIMDILSEYNDRGHTVVVITHDMALAAEYTDRLLVLSEGTVIEDGPPEEVFLQREHLEETNIRPPQITQLGAALRERAGGEVIDEMWLSVEDGYEDLHPFVARRTEASSSGPEDD